MVTSSPDVTSAATCGSARMQASASGASANGRHLVTACLEQARHEQPHGAARIDQGYPHAALRNFRCGSKHKTVARNLAVHPLRKNRHFDEDELKRKLSFKGGGG